MAVEVKLNGVALSPQPAEVNWGSDVIQQKLDGTDIAGAYEIVTLRTPNETGGTANFNWASYENQVLTSAILPPRYSTMRQSEGVVYSSGVVSRKITAVTAPPGGVIEAFEMVLLVVV